MSGKNTIDALEFIRSKKEKNPEYAAKVEAEKLNLMLSIRIREMRKEMGYTQQQLAELIGTHQTAIARIENVDTEYNFTITTLIKIIRALDYTLDFNIRRKKPTTSKKQLVPA